MTIRNCWIQDNNVESELRTFFTEVGKQVSTYYEQHPSTFEPHLDGQLVGALRNQHLLDLSRQRIRKERLGKDLRPLALKIDVRHVTESESVHGADLGVVCIVQVPGEYSITKAALVQAKRLYPNSGGQFVDSCNYAELFKTTSKLHPQWQRLLHVTPSSVYILYGPTRLKVKRTLRDFGLRVITAQHIAGIAESTRQFSAADAYDRGLPFANWIVDEFICCNVGDTRKEVIDTALGRNSNFPVRFAIEIAISTDQETLPFIEQ